PGRPHRSPQPTARRPPLPPHEVQVRDLPLQPVLLEAPAVPPVHAPPDEAPAPRDVHRVRRLHPHRLHVRLRVRVQVQLRPARAPVHAPKRHRVVPHHPHRAPLRVHPVQVAPRPQPHRRPARPPVRGPRHVPVRPRHPPVLPVHEPHRRHLLARPPRLPPPL